MVACQQRHLNKVHHIASVVVREERGEETSEGEEMNGEVTRNREGKGERDRVKGGQEMVGEGEKLGKDFFPKWEHPYKHY